MRVKSTGAWISVALGCVLALVLLCWKSFSAEVVYPVERARVSFVRQVWTRLTGLFDGSAAASENLKLRRELAGLRLVQNELTALENENARLRRLLDYSSRHPLNLVPAAVLSAEGSAAAAHATIRVDKGSLNGIREGAIVVVPEGLVGRVTAVSFHTAEVTLVSDTSLQVVCEIESAGAPPPRGVVSGGSSERLVIKHFFRGEQAKRDARVVTAGLGGVFPRGLVIGTYLGAGEVRPAVDYSALEDVFICRER